MVRAEGKEVTPTLQTVSCSFCLFISGENLEKCWFSTLWYPFYCL